MIAYAFLGSGAVPLQTGLSWPVPRGKEPGPWVSVSGPLEPYDRGVHAYRLGDLPAWIDDELWLVELASEIVEADGALVARRGRLLRRLGDWNVFTARAFVEACVWRFRDLARAKLSEAGFHDMATEFDRCSDLDALRALAASCARSLDGSVAEVCAFTADLVALAGGLRPDDWESTPDEGEVATPAAIAANIGFVTAHAAGRVAAARAGKVAYEPAFSREREWQTTWLVERCGLARFIAGEREASGTFRNERGPASLIIDKHSEVKGEPQCRCTSSQQEARTD